LATLLLVGLLTACSGQTPPTSSAPLAASSTAANANPLGKDYKGPPTPCDKEISPRDVTDLLAQPANVNHYSMSASAPGEGCEMGSGTGFSAFIDIAIKKAPPEFFKAMTSFTPGKPLQGVGDEAADFGSKASNIPDATEIGIIARKGDWVCQASLHRKNGTAGDNALVSTNPADIVQKLGGLCNKLFAAHS
jgi:hypothetical protein